jgi:hypothetical protein
MDYRQKTEVFTAKRREFGRLSGRLGALFIIAFVVAIFVDLDGVLQYFNLVRGSPLTTLEMGAIITSASAVAFLAMGMSISADNRSKQTERE